MSTLSNYIKNGDSYSTKIVKCVNTISFNWDIENFSSYTNVGERIVSPQFSSGIYDKWYIIFWPNGNRIKDSSIHCALFCSNITSAKYEISLKKLNMDYNINGHYYDDDDYYDYGYNYETNTNSYVGSANFDGKNFISHKMGERKWLLENKRTYFPNDIFSIVCEVTTEEKHLPDVELNSTNLLFLDMSSLFKNNSFSDVDIIVCKTTIPAHKCILAARSPVFKAMFSSGMKESHGSVVHINNLDEDVVLEMLKYIYTANYPNPEIIDRLVGAAEMYSLSELTMLCEEILIKKLSSERFCFTIVLSNLYNMANLKIACLDFGIMNMPNLINTPDFEKLYKEPTIIKDVIEKYVNANIK